ncbi:RNA methyltransferase, TrmH family [Caloramator quimbayensis]|uniref:RNA methyltransferase, TrmH family n=1 Tax=Caloramator quimbayensis TaxID=1147123 RepID=A0A1T4XHM1_9CLOT|nr:RNA methyltransferase [Caloramator quimbayensis]SKA89040.1 RNA methyltransferase, TrmH family [Caloramator quimbayensis]
MLSRENKLIKDSIKLKQKKYRDKEGLFLIEGIRFIEEAVKDNSLKYLLYSSRVYETNGSERILNSNIEKYEVSDDIIKELCDTENPQGAVGVSYKKNWNIDDFNKDFIVIADGIQDPGNLGTIIRTCDAAGAGGVIILKGCVDVYNSKTLRSTMGSIFHIPILFYDDFEKLSKDVKSKGYNIYGASLDAQKYIYDIDFKKKSAIIIGNEANGIPESHFEYVDEKIKIPMIGSAESLNASIAAGIIIYEVVRQRISVI